MVKRKINQRVFDIEKLKRECTHLSIVNEGLVEQLEEATRRADLYERLAHELSDQVSEMQGIAPLRKAS